jgi:hypothetical protein
MLTGPLNLFFGPFFRAYRAGPTRLDPLRIELGQRNEPTGLDGSVRFSNRAWRAGPKNESGFVGWPFSIPSRASSTTSWRAWHGRQVVVGSFLPSWTRTPARSRPPPPPAPTVRRVHHLRICRGSQALSGPGRSTQSSSMHLGFSVAGCGAHTILQRNEEGKESTYHIYALSERS